MGKPIEPEQDHSKDWLKFTGLGCAWYGGGLLLLIALIAVLVALFRWIF
jgi:hypothetical protein